MKSILLKITCITNMHVGSDNVTYSLVDNEVEKDAVTNYPIINASGVKGAFRQALKDELGNKEEDIFGRASTNNDSAIEKGKLKFLPAHMLARPMRTTTGKKTFYLVTTEGIMEQFVECLSCFGFKISDYTQKQEDSCVEVEGIHIEAIKEKSIKEEKSKNESVIPISLSEFSEELYIMEDKTFRNIDLPVLARNCLQRDGNLWYEEVVPHHSVFYSLVLSDGTPDGKSNLEEFRNKLKEKQIIHFGGNETIGYGFTKVEVVAQNWREKNE